MKKKYILALSLLLLSSSALYPSTEKPNSTNQNLQTSAITTDTQHSQDEDEFDDLINDALDVGVVSEKIEFPKPSKLETLVRKISVIFFLKPYIYIVTKYRTTKKLVSRYAQIILAKIQVKRNKNA